MRQSLKVCVIVSRALLHMGQRKEISIPLFERMAQTGILWWQHCQRKHLIFWRDCTFHTHSSLKVWPDLLLSSQLARQYASLSLNSPLGEEYHESRSSPWLENGKKVAFISNWIEAGSSNDNPSQFQPTKLEMFFNLRFSSPLFRGPEIRLRKGPMFSHLSTREIRGYLY